MFFYTLQELKRIYRVLHLVYNGKNKLSNRNYEIKWNGIF